MGSRRWSLVMPSLLLAAIMAGATGTATAQDEPQRYLDEVFTDVTVTSDVVYGAATNDQGQLEQLTLDIYVPAGDTEAERPAFVWAHGGSLVFGDKAGSMEKQIGHAFARRGWVVVSINYRLMSQFFPGDCLHDIICATSPRLPLALKDGQHDMQAAVRYLRAHAAELRIDTDEITTGGHSAGTALALLTNFNPNDPGDSGNPGYPSDVAGAMTNSGTLFEPSTIGPGEPPIIMFNSTNDSDMTLWVGLAMTCVPTTAVGNVCEMHIYPDGGHSLSIHRGEVIQRTAEFFCGHVIEGCGTPSKSSIQVPTDAGAVAGGIADMIVSNIPLP